MDWCLIGAAVYEWAFWSWIIDPSAWLVILLVAVGLGAVIFIHELGHFVVAKLCGVKCEKFYLGFDIAGWRICRFRWGETEYGIGVLPLGGYVKMLGQEDNPARLKEEIERAKAAQAANALGVTRESAEGEETPIDLAEAEAALYDPRSYLAQSVPKRMAIISAGVIMNMVFALVAAMAAYAVGVKEEPCEIGSVQPGYPAWQCDLRPGDRIVDIDGEPARRFKDCQTRIPLSEKGVGATLRIERPGATEPIELVIHPSRDLVTPVIGVIGPNTTTLLKSTGWLNHTAIKPWVPDSMVARAAPPFAPGDTIVKVDDIVVKTEPQLRELLSARRDRAVPITVKRAPGEGKPAEQIAIKVDPQPMRELGLAMTMGPIMAVQDHSPAAKAGIQAGDRLVAIDGKPVGDPMTLPDRLWKQVNEAVAEGKPAPTVALTIHRFEEVKGDGGKTQRTEKTLDVPVTLRKTDAFETARFASTPISVPSLGIACRVLNTVAAVSPDGPAAKAGVAPGDELIEATLVPPDEASLASQGFEPKEAPERVIEFTDKKLNWPLLMTGLQECMLPGSTVKLRFKGDKSVSLKPVDAANWFNPERGFLLQPQTFTLTAKSFGEALKLGGDETLLQASLSFRFIKRLSTGDISLKAIGGPVTIAKFAGMQATRGLSDFLTFLTMISVSLAVLNFLPIPVLDGGHFVFLLYEGIRGKPADERVQLALSYVGLVLILALMIWALGLDFGMISRD